MILGIGTDIVDNRRFVDAPMGLLEKIYTERELEEYRLRLDKAQYLGSRFAAKEAFVKALGTGFGSVAAKDVCIVSEGNARPYIVLSDKVDFHGKIHLSISHENDYSTAMVVIEDGSL